MSQELQRKSRRSLIGVSAIAAAIAIAPAAALGVASDFFQPSTSPETAGPAPISLTAANFNGDAFTDLVVTDTDDSYAGIDILLGSASGNFTRTAGSPEPVGGTSLSAAAGDFDGDTDNDLAVANLNDDDLSILFNDGAGSFTPGGTVGTGDAPTSVVAANFDAAPDIELAVANGGDFDNTVYVMSNNGSGVFSFDEGDAVGLDPRFLVAGRFDGDADNDLAVANRDDNSVTILLNDGSSNFTEPVSSAVNVGDSPNGLATGNFGGDANTDLAVANRFDDNVTILIGSATGEFNPAGTSPEPAGDQPRSVVAANLGGSAATDLAVANADSDNVSILIGAGNGNFTAAGTSPETVGDEPFSIAAGVFGGGSGLDLATANPEGGNVTILLNDAPGATVKCGGKTATKVGTAGKNKLVGTNGPDVIAGLGGNDTIRGRGGKDILCGAAGKDKLIGGKGRDTLIGGKGKDTLRGGPGRDKLKGGPGRDRQIQ